MELIRALVSPVFDVLAFLFVFVFVVSRNVMLLFALSRMFTGMQRLLQL